jgi:ATP-dependent DNA helicase RecG
MLTVFGDLDLSLITELPVGRKPITTTIVPPTKRQTTYDFIRKEIQNGRQAFVICPRIEPSSDANATQTNADLIKKNQRLSAFNSHKSAVLTEVKTVKEEYEKLSKKIFPDLQVAMIHGQMPAKEKEKIMKEFRENKINILVATSVIEVGVDIPNASIMMIEGADRFGLAQLYQFRGRVGRGEHQSYCFLMTDVSDGTAKARLKAIEKAKNGFELAEEDMKLRGPGEFLGEAQSGFSDTMIRALRDPLIVKESREAAMDILQNDPRLLRAPILKEKLAEFERAIHRE